MIKVIKSFFRKVINASEVSKWGWSPWLVTRTARAGEPLHIYTVLWGELGVCWHLFPLFQNTNTHKRHMVGALTGPCWKNYKRAGRWWCMPLVPTLGRQGQEDFWVRGQPGLQSEFQDSQVYPVSEKKKKKKRTTNERLPGTGGWGGFRASLGMDAALMSLSIQHNKTSIRSCVWC
jgi:hypothetical protein